jgi:hypothetical protein
VSSSVLAIHGFCARVRPARFDGKAPPAEGASITRKFPEVLLHRG